MTVIDLITRSLRLIGAINVGDPVPTAAEQQDALVALNSLVSGWATERLTMYASVRTVFAIVAGQQVYTIGPSSADWTAPRPQYIDEAGLLIAGSDPTGTAERPLKILTTDKEWARVPVKGVSSTLPTALYYQPDYPNGQIALWPAPSASSLIALYTPTAITQFTSLTQTISLPPGYDRALAYSLATELAAEFGLTPNPIVMSVAIASKDTLKRANVRLNKLRTDKTLALTGGHWDYMIGEAR